MRKVDWAAVQYLLSPFSSPFFGVKLLYDYGFWWGWGVHAHPLSLSLPSRAKLQCTLQLSGQNTLSPTSSLPIYVLCGTKHKYRRAKNVRVNILWSRLTWGSGFFVETKSVIVCYSDRYHWLTDPDPAPDPVPGFFCQWPTRCEQKNFFANFLDLLLSCTFTSVSKDRKSKIEEIKVFLNFLLVDRRIRIRMRIQEAL